LTAFGRYGFLTRMCISTGLWSDPISESLRDTTSVTSARSQRNGTSCRMGTEYFFGYQISL